MVSRIVADEHLTIGSDLLAAGATPRAEHERVLAVDVPTHRERNREHEHATNRE
jgi:hypothetical protein